MIWIKTGENTVARRRASLEVVLWRVVLFHFRAGSGFDYGIRAGFGRVQVPKTRPNDFGFRVPESMKPDRAG